MEDRPRFRFNPPSGWFRRGVGAYLPASWEGWLIFLVLIGVGIVVTFDAFVMTPLKR